MSIIDIAKRVHDHTWKIDPIVRSLIDTDFYKLLMAQTIFRNKPDVDVTFSLINRSKDIRIADAVSFKAGERELVESAVAGDIIGLHNHGTIQIGDTFTSGEALQFTGIPHFAPELFRYIIDT